MKQKKELHKEDMETIFYIDPAIGLRTDYKFELATPFVDHVISNFLNDLKIKSEFIGFAGDVASFKFFCVNMIVGYLELQQSNNNPFANQIDEDISDPEGDKDHVVAV